MSIGILPYGGIGTCFENQVTIFRGDEGWQLQVGKGVANNYNL